MVGELDQENYHGKEEVKKRYVVCMVFHGSQFTVHPDNENYEISCDCKIELFKAEPCLV